MMARPIMCPCDQRTRRSVIVSVGSRCSADDGASRTTDHGATDRTAHGRTDNGATARSDRTARKRAVSRIVAAGGCRESHHREGRYGKMDRLQHLSSPIVGRISPETQHIDAATTLPYALWYSLGRERRRNVSQGTKFPAFAAIDPACDFSRVVGLCSLVMRSQVQYL